MNRRGVAAAVMAGLVTGYIALCVIVADDATRAQRTPPRTPPSAISSVYEHVTFRTSDGLSLQGWFFAPPPRRDTNCLALCGRVVLVLHGKDGNWTSEIELVRMLLSHDATVLSFDMRGHGNSEGERFSLGQYERLDVAAAVDLIMERGVPGDRIVLLGRSMGAGVALQALAERPQVGHVIADSAFSDGRVIVEEAGPADIGLHQIFLPGVVLAARLLYGLDVDRVAPAEVVRAHTDRPILFIHCERDATIHPDHSRRLRMASGVRSDLWIVPDCGHAAAYRHSPRDYSERIVRFLQAR